MNKPNFYKVSFYVNEKETLVGTKYFKSLNDATQFAISKEHRGNIIEIVLCEENKQLLTENTNEC